MNGDLAAQVELGTRKEEKFIAQAVEIDRRISTAAAAFEIPVEKQPVPVPLVVAGDTAIGGPVIPPAVTGEPELNCSPLPAANVA